MRSIGKESNRKETVRKTPIKMGRSNQKRRRRIRWRIRLEGERAADKLEGKVLDGMPSGRLPEEEKEYIINMIATFWLSKTIIIIHFYLFRQL